jgi:hypothetical protein
MLARNPKLPTEMSHPELVSSLIAFTLIGGVIDAFNIVAFVRSGFSLFTIVCVVFASAILIQVWIQIGGELRRRRRVAQTAPPLDVES